MSAKSAVCRSIFKNKQGPCYFFLLSLGHKLGKRRIWRHSWIIFRNFEFQNSAIKKIWWCMGCIWQRNRHSIYIKTLDQLNYSIASGIPVALRIVKCWNISHHSHMSYKIYKIYHFDHKVHENMYVYGSDDWYFSTWQSSMPLEFHWQLSNWVPLLRAPEEWKTSH